MPAVSKLKERFADNDAFNTSYERARAYIRLGTELRRMREDMELTQDEVATRTGLDQADISKIEAGKWGSRGISFTTLSRLLPLYGLQGTYTVSPLPGAKLSKDEQEHASVINEVMQLNL